MGYLQIMPFLAIIILICILYKGQFVQILPFWQLFHSLPTYIGDSLSKYCHFGNNLTQILAIFGNNLTCHFQGCLYMHLMWIVSTSSSQIMKTPHSCQLTHWVSLMQQYS